ncbi:MAG: catalase HPII, partial [Proteobacteria bacterium]|nr:catalase HPII [Pseudomonadota bacterium]
NIDTGLADQVIEGLRLTTKPEPLKPAKPVNTTLAKSTALSIMLNGPQDFKGRKLGVLLSDNVDANLFYSLQKQVSQIQAVLEIIAPQVGGVKLSDGSWIQADQNIDGGPSVLYDAIVILINTIDTEKWLKMLSVRDFITDAYFHCKFIGYSQGAQTLIQKLGLSENMDQGFVQINEISSIEKFLTKCGQLRFWQREKA